MLTRQGMQKNKNNKIKSIQNQMHVYYYFFYFFNKIII